MKRFVAVLGIVGISGIAVVTIFESTCRRSPDSESPIIARVGRSILTLDNLRQRIPPEYSKTITREQRINYVKQWIDNELLYYEATRRKIHKEPVIRSRVARMKKDLLTAELISRTVSASNSFSATEEAVRAYYEQHKDFYIRDSDVVKYLDIVVDNLKTAWVVRNMVTPDNFADLALRYSRSPVQDSSSASFVPLNRLPEAVASIIFRIRANGTTSPIQMPDGYHIIRVLDKRNAGDTCLVEEVRDEIVSTLSARAQKRRVQDFVAKLRDKTDYEYHFDLIGRHDGRGPTAQTLPDTG